MLTGSPTNLLRQRGHGHATVTTVELFFDLVFVFAVTQLSHTMLEHFTPLGVFETTLLFVAVWWTWINTSWVTNWMDPKFVVVRRMLFVLMLTGLVMSMAIPKAFGERGLVFALGFAATQAIRDLFMLWALRHHHRANFRNFQRIATWHAVAVALWIAGGLVDPQWRLPIWLVALAIDTLGPSMFYYVPGLGRSTLADWDVDGAHFAERSGLFVIIALGESILITGATYATLDWTWLNAAAFLQAFLGSVAMWWIYFNIGADRAAAIITKAKDPGRIARFAYTYMHIVIIAGIIVCAVADELVLMHPSGHSDVKLVASGIGGPVLYLAGNALFKRTIYGWLPLSHLVGLGLLVALALAAAWMSPLAICSTATAILIIVAIWETRSVGHTAT